MKPLMRSAVVCSMFILGTSAFADVSSALSAVYPAMFGQQATMIAPAKAADCTTMQSGSGWIQRPNIINCFLKYDLSLNGVGSTTQQFSIGGQTQTLHAEITSGCTTNNVSGSTTNYNYQINGWMCVGGTSTCTSPSQFSRLMSLCYSYVDDGTGLNGSVNEGELITDTSLDDGLSAPGDEAMYMVYDLGSSSAAQKAVVKQVQTGIYATRGDITRTDKNHIGFAITFDSLNASNNPAPNLRFTGNIDRTSNTGTAYIEAAADYTGTGTTSTVNATAAGDTAAGGACFSRTASATDWNYTVTSSGASCIPSMPNTLDSLNTVAAYTVSGLAGTWHGMAANPSTL